MTMTQRYAGMLRRHAAEWDKQAMPVQAECSRQAARHMEELQAAHDAITNPWQPMRTAPMDGTAVLALLDGSDIPLPIRWDVDIAGWRVTWDDYVLSDTDGPRYWMPCPDDPEADEASDGVAVGHGQPSRPNTSEADK